MPTPLFRRDWYDHPTAADIRVQVITDERGRVQKSAVCSGPEELRPFVEDAVRNAVIKPTMHNGTPAGVSGQLIYRFDPAISYESPYDFGCAPSARTGGSILNGYSIELPKPVPPPEVDRLKLYGSSSAAVLIDENGNFESIQAVSGHQILRPAVVDAVKRSRFRRFLRCGKPIKISGVVTYNFPRP